MTTRKKNMPKPPPEPPAKHAELLKRIKPVEQLPQIMSALFYGRAGTGKTTIAATFPKPLLLLDCRDQGTDSIMDVEGIQVLPVEHWNDFEEVYWYLKSGKHEFKTVVVDTVTQLQDFAIIRALEDDGKEAGDPITKRTWGTVSGLMRTWILNFRDLPMHVVLTAQDRENDVDEDQRDEMTPSIGPRVIPSVSGTLCAAVKVVGNAFIKEVIRERNQKMVRRTEYRLRIGPHTFYHTKVRKPKSAPMPASIKDPEYKTILSIMKGEYVRPTKPKKEK